jgi:hypothetical protein
MTATDPRAAALAEALHRIRGHRDLHSDFRGCSSCSPDAAAILAALPPDWCGDGAEIKRLREALGRASASAEKAATIWVAAVFLLLVIIVGLMGLVLR